MTLVTPNTGDIIQAPHIGQLTGLVAGTVGKGQDVRFTQKTNASDYANVMGNVDTTNGYALKVQYGDPGGAPVSLLTVAKASAALGTKLAYQQTPLNSLVSIAPDNYEGLAISLGSPAGLAGVFSGSLVVQERIKPNQNSLQAAWAGANIFQHRFGSVTVSDTVVASATSTTLTVAGTPYVVNALVGQQVQLISGTGMYPGTFQPRTIVSNTTSTITVNSAWTVMPDATTHFLVNDGGAQQTDALTIFSYDDSTISLGPSAQHSPVALQVFAKQSATSTAGMFGTINIVDNTSSTGKAVAGENDVTNASTHIAPRGRYAGRGPQDNVGLILLSQISGTAASISQAARAATGAANTPATLTDTTKNGVWTLNQYAGLQVWIKSGKGSGQVRQIVSNTATPATLTLDANWTATAIPDTTSQYVIYTAGPLGNQMGLWLTAGTNGWYQDGIVFGAGSVGSDGVAIDFLPLIDGTTSPNVIRMGSGQAIVGRTAVDNAEVELFDWTSNVLTITNGNASMALTGADVNMVSGKLTVNATGVAVYGATPAARPTAYTQTSFATAQRTADAFTSTGLSGISSSTTGSALAEPGAAYSQATDQQNYRRIQDQFNLIRSDLSATKQLLNSVIDDLQAYGWLQ